MIKAQIYLHAFLFVLFLTIVFFQGALNAARAEALVNKEIKRLISASLIELSYERIGS